MQPGDEDLRGGHTDREWTAGLLRTTREQIADLREKRETIKRRYDNSPPADDPELQAVIIKLRALRKVAADLERELLGE